MSGSEHFRKLERMYVRAPINRFYSPEIRVGDGEAEVAIEVRPDLYHAAAAVHGSVYFKILDDAAWFAVNSLVEDVCVLTASFNLHLLRPVTAGRMRATGRVVHRSQRLFVAEAVAKNDGGERVALGSGTFMWSSIKLSPEIGYE